MRKILLAGLVILAGVWFAGIGLAQTADAPPRFKGVKVTELPQGLAVILETSGPLRYQATLIDSPNRIVIDMNGTYAAPKMRWVPTPEPIREIRGSQWKPATARVVVELTRQVTYRIHEGATALTLTIEGSRVETARAEAPKSPEMAAAASKSGALKPDRPTPSEPKKRDEIRPDAPKVDRAGASAPKLDAPKAEAKTQPTAAAALAAPAAAPARVAQTPPPGGAQPGTSPTPEAQPQAPNGSKLITLDFKDADVINVLRLLGAEGGRNIVVGDDVKGKVSVSLRNVTWDQALETILEARGLQKIEKGGVIRIVSSEQLAKEREIQARAEEAKRKAEIEVRTKMVEAQLKESELAARRAAAEAAVAEAQARGPLREEVVRLSYADPEEVARTLQGILGIPPEGTLPVGGPTGPPAVIPSIGISGPPFIAEPPFSQLYGAGLQPRPATVVSVSQDVLAKGITIKANKATNSIFLRLYEQDLERIKKLVHEYLDVPLPQVKIEARMEILDRTALEAIGIQWGGGGATTAGKATLVGQGFADTNTGGGIAPSNLSPANPNLSPLSSLLPISSITGLPQGGNLVNLPLAALPNSAGVLPAAGLAFGIVGTNFNINLALQALATLGKTRTLARPEIVTVENNKAAISLGEEIPYATVSSAGTQVQFKEAVLRLEVTPTVIRERTDSQQQTKIKMVVVVENNSRGDVVNLGTSGSPPAINKRKAETLVLMNEGERLVIGGVTTAVNQNTIRKVPIFGDIPVLGWLFKQRENFETGREMVVFVTPSVLKALVAAPGPGK